MNAFSIFYFLLLGFLWILAIPFLFLISFKQKYRQSIPSRFFLYKNRTFNDHNIWFHGCSFGEIKSFQPIIKELNKSVDLTTTTQTGFLEAEKNNQNVRYLPFEIFLPFWIKKPKILVVTEAELWFLLFFIAKKNGAKTILINARISDKSLNSYRRFKWFYKKIFSVIDIVFAQSEIDAKRLKEFGAQKIFVNGNIKTASIPKVSKQYNKPNRRIITIASSHEKEEREILKSIKIDKNDMIIIAPRHPERFEKVKRYVYEYANKLNLSCKTFSNDGFCECDILVCDTLGELINIYAITDITILCGSFVDKIGGHNPLECGYFKNILISGKYIHNQKALYKLVENIYMCEFHEIDSLLNQDLKQSFLKNENVIEPILKEIRRAI